MATVYIHGYFRKSQDAAEVEETVQKMNDAIKALYELKDTAGSLIYYLEQGISPENAYSVLLTQMGLCTAWLKFDFYAQGILDACEEAMGLEGIGDYEED